MNVMILEERHLADTNIFSFSAHISLLSDMY